MHLEMTWSRHYRSGKMSRGHTMEQWRGEILSDNQRITISPPFDCVTLFRDSAHLMKGCVKTNQTKGKSNDAILPAMIDSPGRICMKMTLVVSWFALMPQLSQYSKTATLLPHTQNLLHWPLELGLLPLLHTFRRIQCGQTSKPWHVSCEGDRSVNNITAKLSSSSPPGMLGQTHTASINKSVPFAQHVLRRNRLHSSDCCGDGQWRHL